ncbi:MAG: DUF302 domain-containing protein [Pseudomonadota bacterium]
MLRTLALLFALSAVPTQAEMAPREGWSVLPSQQSYADLLSATRAAIKDNGLAIVTQAGPTKAAANRGITIPGNTVIGAYNNDFAVRVLNLSTAAMIEAPIRFYVTENADGTATLSYKQPSTVFAPYMADAGEELEAIAAELDEVFAAVAEAAVN